MTRNQSLFPTILATALCLCHPSFAKDDNAVVSPDKKISARLQLSADGKATYSVYHSNTLVIAPSKLGIVREDENFSEKLKLESATKAEVVKDSYHMLHGKRHDCTYTANKVVYHLRNATGKPMDIIFQVSNDGVAFRYYFPETSTDVKKITSEITSFRFDTATRAFLHPCPDSKTGWARTQPSYEEHYDQGNKVGKAAPFKAGWVFPALYHYKKYWYALTETALERNYCASRLAQDSPNGEYSILFPQPTEGFPDGAVTPASTLPWYTPWRIITLADNLATLMESTLGTDLATPAKYDVSEWLKPGHASWSWIIEGDKSITYDVQKKYIDYAADMKWDYCLVDAYWDTNIGYDKMKELADYAKTKNVDLLVWYNSAGAWNTTPQTPKNAMLTDELRNKEFKRIEDLGIRGVKIDFFGGDGQSMIAYYQDILETAGKYHIAVNFHGCTLPRGWARTYPNLVSMEAVMGFEYLTFDQKNTNLEPNHCCMLPFTRNLFDPMDFTPVNFSGIPRHKRATSASFELGLSVIFLSGIQHYAETPDGMSKQPDYVKAWMRNLPSTWDEVRFLDGYPGKFVVIARRSGTDWYIAGINGENDEKTVSLNLSFLPKDQPLHLIADGAERNSFLNETIANPSSPLEIKLKATGGFVITTRNNQ
jgi:alpha-glucosidase